MAKSAISKEQNQTKSLFCTKKLNFWSHSLAFNQKVGCQNQVFALNYQDQLNLMEYSCNFSAILFFTKTKKHRK